MINQVEQYHRLLQNQMEPTAYIFLRIGVYRFGLTLILMAMVHLIGNYFVFYPVLFLGGVAFGYAFSLLSYCFGGVGILCMLAYMFPHYLIYIPLVLGILRSVDANMERVLPRNFKRTGLVFLGVFLGCAVESSINPVFLKIFLKTFL